MKEWYYMVSDESYKKYYFDSYEDTKFAILCVFRFKAPINEVPDYTIYHNGKIFETIFGDNLFNMYVENGGHVYEECLRRDKANDANEQKRNELDALSKTIEDSTNSLKRLFDSIEKLNNMLS